jgi:hypothetical protein
MQVIRETAKITKTTVDAAWRRRSANQRLIVRDKDCRGLALIVNATTMTWTFAYRPRGNDPQTGKRWPNKTMTLGNPATLSPDDARIEANSIKGQAVAGGDPAAARKAARAEQQQQRAATLARLVDEYETALPKRPKLRGAGVPSEDYVADEIARLRVAVAVAVAEMDGKEKPVARVSETDLRRVLKATAGRTATARARFGALSRFLDWCQDEGHIKVNPCVLVA